MMRKILVPFDGSESAIRAVRYAVSLARDIPGMQIELLNVQDPMAVESSPTLSEEEISQARMGEAMQILQPAQQFCEQAGVPYHAQVRAGAAANKIAEHARDAACEAIIMGTRGMSPMTALMVGSVANNVINLVEVPVTLVK